MSEANLKRRGRKPLIVDRLALIAEILRLESQNAFPSLSALYAAVAEGEWNQNNHKLNPIQVMTQIKKLGIEPDTKPGKKGGENNDFGRSKGTKPKRARKGMPSEHAAQILDNLPEWANQDKVLKLLEKAENGPGMMRACIALKCLDCTVHQPKEIRACQSFDCALYHLRPYKGPARAEDNAEVQPETEMVEV